MSSQNELRKHIQALEKAAAEVLTMKKNSRPKRPIIIEFSGSPKSGKSQAATSLTIFLKRNGFNVRVLTERASVSPVTDKRSPFFNAWTGCSILTGLIPYLSEAVSDVDVLIADRGIFDTLSWFTWLVDNGSMSEAEKNGMVGFFLTKRFRQSTDLVLAFTASPEASMEREYANLLTRKFGSIMAPNVLQSYVGSVKKAIDEYGPMFKKVNALDTSDLTQNDVAVKVTRIALDAMREELVEKVGVLSRSSLEGIANDERVFDAERLSSPELKLTYVPRSTAESDTSLVQLVSVVVVADSARRQVMVFRKRKETLGHPGSPERERNLLYVGGHVRDEDGFGLDRSNILDVLTVGVQREMAEELGTNLRLDDSGIFCIWDFDGQESSQKHLAVVHVATVSFEELKLRLDGYELVQPHNSPISGKVIDATDALSWSPKLLESWSREILSRIFKVAVGEHAELMDFDTLASSDLGS